MTKNTRKAFSNFKKGFPGAKRLKIYPAASAYSRVLM